MVMSNHSTSQRASNLQFAHRRPSDSTSVLRINEPQLLVLLLTPLTPLRRNVDPILFLLVTLRLVLMYARRLVLRRRIHSVQDQRSRASVDKMMLLAGRHDD